jgi:hypothetical protein
VGTWLVSGKEGVVLQAHGLWLRRPARSSNVNCHDNDRILGLGTF